MAAVTKIIRSRVPLISAILGTNVRWFSSSLNHCQTQRDGIDSTVGESSQNHEQYSSSEAEPEPTVEDIQKIVLDAALEFVPVHGWTIQSLAEAAKNEGYPGIAHGIFPRGGGDLVHHFVKECNSQLAEQLAVEANKEAEEGERKKTGAFIRDALQTRIRMIIPYHAQWPEAMVLTARPENITEHFSNLANLMDIIWYHAGDRSADFNWYTKRVALATVYKSTELCFVQDKSPDFEDTWNFLDNRLTDFTRFSKFRGEIETTGAAVSDFLSAAVTSARNVAGLNSRK